MTSAKTEEGLWALTFSEAEADFIINTMARMGAHYQEDVSKMLPSLQAYWRGILSRGAEPESADIQEAQEILAESREELRAERLDLVETWLRDYELAETHNPWTVEISSENRDEFISILNDRRMLLSIDLKITQEDMDAELTEISHQGRRSAVLEIDVLGHFILVVLGPQIYRP